MELRQRDKRKGELSFNSGGTVELDQYITRAENAAAQAAESAAAAASQLGQVGVNADAIAALRREVDSIGENLAGKYTIPIEGVPKIDLSEDVRASLGRADTALQPDALSAYRTAAAQDEIDGGKQAKLVSGENLKTVDGQTLLGAGDLAFHYSRPNLLDNWYFVGGGSQKGNGVFPINQRGQTQYSNPGSFIFDRWKLISGTVQLVNDGLLLNGTIQQTIAGAVNQQFTATVLTADGVVSGNYYQSTQVFSITGDGSNVIKAAKLELGSFQTLAYEEDGGNGSTEWVVNEMPAYSAELTQCLRYLWVIQFPFNWARLAASGYTETTVDSARIILQPIVPMVSVPTVTVSIDGGELLINTNNGDKRIQLIHWANNSGSAITIAPRIESAYSTNSVIMSLSNTRTAAKLIIAGEV